PLPVPPETSAGAAPAVVPPASGSATAGGPRFEVMYLLEAPDEVIPAFKQAWDAIGDSIVVVGGDGTWNCHIHTDDIGAAVEAALDAGGRPRRITVTDLEGQVEEERWVREAAASAPTAEPGTKRVTTAVVAVAAGAGLDRIFRSLGASAVLAGGQSMNPSTAEILEAVEAAPADQVVVLPNNKNIVPVAEQVDALTAKTVRVVPTRSVPGGMAALLDYDADTGADANAEAMAAAAGRVVAGAVTRAVRASSSTAGPIDEGAWLGLSGSSIEVVAPSVVEAATGLLARLVTDEHELVTVIVGEGAGSGDTEAIGAWLEGKCPHVAVEVHDGDQPLYPYLFSIE
ncbi:MAG: hypothetical protein M3Q48_15745, partial [Actinomycetota bacterium]|nr:hypothetical protein [Actinomycetota bacterium]